MTTLWNWFLPSITKSTSVHLFRAFFLCYNKIYYCPQIGLAPFWIYLFLLLKKLSLLFHWKRNHWRKIFWLHNVRRLKKFFIWRTIAVQCYVGFRCTTLWISLKYTHMSSLLSLPPPSSPPVKRFLPSGSFQASVYRGLIQWGLLRQKDS